MSSKPKSKPKAKPKPPSPVPSPPEPTPNTRIFNPHAYFPTDLLENPNEPCLPLQITLVDPDTGLTNPLFFGRVTRKSGFSANTKGKEERKGDPNEEDSEKKAGSEGRAAYCIFFGPDSKFNTHCLMQHQKLQSAQAAELAAVRTVLQFLQYRLFGKAYHIRKLVVMTHSEYVVQSLTRNVWKWEAKGYKTSRRKAVVNEDLFKKIAWLVLDLEEDGITVEFWKVTRAENENALRLAEKGFERDSDDKDKKRKKEESEGHLHGPTTAALTYWRCNAAQSLPAIEICRQANITMSSNSGFREPVDLDNILFKLIIPGLDTPDNFSILCGPEWEDTIKRQWARKRILVLADPPRTSDAKWWHPRAPSEEEKKKYDYEGALKEMRKFALEFI